MTHVDCVRCGVSIPFSAADVVDTGFRCSHCTLQAARVAAEDADAPAFARRAYVLGWLVGPLALLAVVFLTSNVPQLIAAAFGVCCSIVIGKKLVSRNTGMLPPTIARLLRDCI